jgi:hypothetical protein
MTYNTQPQLLQIALDPGDVVYTPDWVAKDMVNFFKPSGRILEPCKGDGVFLKYLPPHTEWCEIEEGRDFFAIHDRYDWIVGNPPYSCLSKWFEHSFRLSDNVLFFIPFAYTFSGMARIGIIRDYGWIPSFRIYGSMTEIGWTVRGGTPAAAVHFQRGYTGPMYTTIYENGRGE